jgi:hypothetical protein
VPRVGDRVISNRSELEYKIARVHSEGKYVDLEMPGTYLTRFPQEVSTLKFLDKAVNEPPELSRDSSGIFERIATI